VDVESRAPVEANDSTSSCGELEWYAFLLPVRAKGAPIGQEGERIDLVAYVPFHVSEELL
jgi:hypothetical protein